MSDLVIHGFPVPPSPVSMWNGLTQKAPLTEIEIYTLQSIGYRAWMDEYKRLDVWDSFGKYREKLAELLALRDEAFANAETCRMWTPKGETE